MIEIDEITKTYDGTTVVDDVTLKVAEGELAAVVGTSGSGKTTLLRMINRLVEPSAGRIRINGLDTRDTPPHELRRRIGYAIQGHGLFPHRTVAQNIATVPELLNWPRPRIEARVDELLNLFQLDPGQFRNRMPAELSGGQQQRVGVARAVAASPNVLLMDEPFGALDPIIRAKAQEDLLALQKQFRTTIVLVTHDMEEAIRLGTRIAVMDKGKVLQYAPPAEIIAQPATPFVGELIGQGERPFRLLSLTTVGEICRPGAASGAPIPMSMSLRDAYAECLWSRRSILPVANESGKVVGVVSRYDLEQRAGRPA
ncbi:MAG TPA: ABC transporter ATP-binding protein [Devosia sp.]|nr:ABC transporter ATP-binding protein [Devosia sp.]